MTGADGEVMRALGEALMITAQNLGAGLVLRRLFTQARGEDAKEKWSVAGRARATRPYQSCVLPDSCGEFRLSNFV